MRAAEGNAVSHHTGLDVVVEEQCDERVLHGAHDDRIVREGIVPVPTIAQFLLQCLLLHMVDLVHEEHLEIVLAGFLLILELFLRATHQLILAHGITAEGAAHEVAHHVVHRMVHGAIFLGVQQLLQACDPFAAGVGPVVLDGAKVLEIGSGQIRVPASLIQRNHLQTELVPCKGAQPGGVEVLATGGKVRCFHVRVSGKDSYRTVHGKRTPCIGIGIAIPLSASGVLLSSWRRASFRAHRWPFWKRTPSSACWSRSVAGLRAGPNGCLHCR